MICRVCHRELELSEDRRVTHLQVIYLLSYGLSAEDIGQLMYRSFRTVQGYIKDAKEMRGVSKNTELIAQALRNGEIE